MLDSYNIPTSSDTQGFPIPKGNSPYALAKRAEYIDRNTSQAKQFYREAIKIGERTESAVKDLASLLHQEGRTREACELLSGFKSIFLDQQKFCNLLTSLKEKLIPTGNCLNKQIKVSPLSDTDTETSVANMFRNPSRIAHVKVTGDLERFALVTFSSHSAARKTLSSFSKWNKYSVEWVSTSGEVVGPAGFKNRKKKSEEEETELTMLLLGKELFAELFTDNYFCI